MKCFETGIVQIDAYKAFSKRGNKFIIFYVCYFIACDILLNEHAVNITCGWKFPTNKTKMYLFYLHSIIYYTK